MLLALGFHFLLVCPPLTAPPPPLRAVILHRGSPFVGVSAFHSPIFVSMILHRVLLFVGVFASDSFISPGCIRLSIGFHLLLAPLSLATSPPPSPPILMMHRVSRVGWHVCPSLAASGGKGGVRHVSPAAAQRKCEQVSPVWRRGQSGRVTPHGQRTTGKPSHHVSFQCT